EYEADDTVGALENEWNDFDHLTPETRILHTTYRRTQPWKTGLPIDFTIRVKDYSQYPFPISVFKRMKNLLVPKKQKTYRPHPDPNQERLFFSLLAECLAQGIVTEELVRREMSTNHVRHDALELCSRAAA